MSDRKEAMPRVQTSNRSVGAALAALALTGLIAVTGMVARAPLSSSSAIDARSAGAPVAALFMLTMGAGIVALTALVVVIWPGRRRRGDDDPELVPEEPQIHWISTLLAILLPFALGATLVASAVLGLRTANRAAAPGSNPQLARSTMPTPPRATGNGFTVPSWVPWTALVIVALTIAAGAWLLLRRRRETMAPAPSDRTATSAAVQAAMTALDTVDDPRQAVIAAYVAMQQSLAATGIARSPAEAPREYLQRVLVASSATEREARTLTGLFEEARFSTHPVSERVRELALSALSSLRAHLQTGSAG